MTASHLGRAIEEAGTVTAGVLLYRIRSKIRAIDCTNGWLAHSYAQWEEDTRLSAQQLRDAIRQLRRVRLIETRQGLFQNKNVLHVRLLPCFGAPLASGPEAPPAQSPGARLIEKEDTEDETEEVKGAIAPPVPEIKQEITPVKMGKTTAEVLMAAQKKSAAAPPAYASLGQFWRETVAKHHKHFQPALTVKEQTALKAIRAKSEGIETKEMLARVIEHWPSFVKEVGWKHPPEYPSVTYVLQHLVVACNFMHIAETKPATKKAPTALTTKPAPQGAPFSQPPTEPKATLDDILAPPTSPKPKGTGP